MGIYLFTYSQHQSANAKIRLGSPSIRLFYIFRDSSTTWSIIPTATAISLSLKTRFPTILLIDVGASVNSNFSFNYRLTMYVDSCLGFYGCPWDGTRIRVEGNEEEKKKIQAQNTWISWSTSWIYFIVSFVHLSAIIIGSAVIDKTIRVDITVPFDTDVWHVGPPRDEVLRRMASSLDALITTAKIIEDRYVAIDSQVNAQIDLSLLEAHRYVLRRWRWPVSAIFVWRTAWRWKTRLLRQH